MVGSAKCIYVSRPLGCTHVTWPLGNMQAPGVARTVLRGLVFSSRSVQNISPPKKKQNTFLFFVAWFHSCYALP